MSLQYYMDEYDLPEDCEIIVDNRKFFVENTVMKLDERVNNLLPRTDNIKYKDEFRFTDRFGYDVPWYCLSTGGMTVLNIFYNQDRIFSTPECGLNAIHDILSLTQGSVYAMGIPNDYDKEDIDLYIIDGDNTMQYNSYSKLKEDYL